MIYNIAVFGSCASRDNFYSGINPDYKKHFNCSVSSQRSSIISLMQEHLIFKKEDITIFPENRVNKAGSKFISQDLTKKFLQDIKETKPDYILIDNYFEVIFGVLEYNGIIITNNYWDLPKTKFHTLLENYHKINMYNNPKRYLELYQENSGLFIDFIQKESANTEIILNPVRLGYKILKNDGNITVDKNFKSNAKITNKLLEKVDHTLKKHSNIITLKAKENKILDENHEWGLGQVHYTQQYYLNILNQLKQIK